MWSIMNHFGIATTILDFTNHLSLLLVGLAGVMGVSGGMIVWQAVRYYLSQEDKSGKVTIPTGPDYRDAA